MLAENSCASSSCCMFACSSAFPRMLMPVDIEPHYDVMISTTRHIIVVDGNLHECKRCSARRWKSCKERVCCKCSCSNGQGWAAQAACCSVSGVNRKSGWTTRSKFESRGLRLVVDVSIAGCKVLGPLGKLELRASSPQVMFDIQSRSLSTGLRWALILTPTTTTKASLYGHRQCCEEQIEKCVQR